MDIKNLLSNFPWVASRGETSYNFFKDRDIRRINLRDWRVLLNRHLAGDDKKPFYNIRNTYVYVVPYYGTSGLVPDHYIGLTENLKPIHEFGTDPFPYGVRSLDRYKENYILCNWPDYLKFHKENGTLEKPSIILNGYTDLSKEVVSDGFNFDWISKVAGCRFVLVESRNQLDFEETKNILDGIGLQYTIKPLVEPEVKHEPVKEVVIREAVKEPVKAANKDVVKENTKKVESDSFYSRQDLVTHLRSSGIEATVDILRKINEYVEVPHKVDEDTKIKLYSAEYHKLYFKYRDSGCTRKIAAEESLKEYMSHT